MAEVGVTVALPARGARRQNHRLEGPLFGSHQCGCAMFGEIADSSTDAAARGKGYAGIAHSHFGAAKRLQDHGFVQPAKMADAEDLAGHRA